MAERSPKLAELDILIVDCQATGATPEQGALLEIGWAIARADGRTDASFSSWVKPPPGTLISPWVRRLTGVDAHDLESAIAPQEAWLRLSEASRPLACVAGRTPAVIHFAHFELGFLRDLDARFGSGSPVQLDVVDLHAAACRLFPELPRRGLRALAGFLGHGTPLERRVAGHVEATAFVWRALLPKFGAAGIETWSELVGWLSSADRKPKRTRRVFPLSREERRALPSSPGVYRMLRSNGDVLYVGKAKNVRSRVDAHFSGAARNGERAMEMLTQVAAVEVAPAVTVLEAALLECDEIKRCRPPYNLQLVESERSAWFVSRALDQAVEHPDREHGVGPLPSQRALAGLAAVRALLLGQEADDEHRAAAVEAPVWAAPGASVFDEAWRAWAKAHLSAARSMSPDALLSRAARTLAPELGAEVAESELAPGDWDVARVRRHLDRTVVRGVHLVRRARLLTLLADSAVVFRERFGEPWRCIVVAGGEILSQGEVESRPPSAPVSRGRRRRQAVFDGPHYDRLRVLATELTRVFRETGEVRVHVGARALDGAALAKLL